jgi:glycosyltransferase involved in cell wall biosynthesis
MKVAYFSPFPPKQTGIATYSDHLVRELRNLMPVDCYDFHNDRADDPSTTFGDFARFGRVSDLRRYDAVVYHVGNNPYVHLDILKILRHWPGIVVLHDVVVYYLFAGLGPPGLLKYLWIVERDNGLDSLKEIVDNSTGRDGLQLWQRILCYPHPERHPLTSALFPYATHIIVHNRSAKEQILKMGYTGPIDVIPFAFHFADAELNSKEVEQLHQRHGIAPDELVIGCFGFIGPTKRIAQICRALSRLKEKLKFRFLVVGEGEDVRPAIESAGLSQVTIRTGFVEDAQFSRYLGLTDIVVNLRYPSMGESSLTLLRAQALGKPVIVTRDATFAEFPDETIYKIDVGADEERDLAAAIETLAQDPCARARMGEAARRYVETTLDGARIARQFQRAIESDIKRRAQNSLAFDSSSGKGVELAADMLRRSLTRAVPEHLPKYFP